MRWKVDFPRNNSTPNPGHGRTLGRWNSWQPTRPRHQTHHKPCTNNPSLASLASRITHVHHNHLCDKSTQFDTLRMQQHHDVFEPKMELISWYKYMNITHLNIQKPILYKHKLSLTEHTIFKLISININMYRPSVTSPKVMLDNNQLRIGSPSTMFYLLTLITESLIHNYNIHPDLSSNML